MVTQCAGAHSGFQIFRAPNSLCGRVYSVSLSEETEQQLVLVNYLYEVKQHQRQHVIYCGHVLSESVHDASWKRTNKKKYEEKLIVVNEYIRMVFNMAKQMNTKTDEYKYTVPRQP